MASIHSTIIRLFLIAVLLLLSCSSEKEDSLTLSMSLGEEEWAIFREKIFPLFEKRSGIKIHAHQIDSEYLSVKLSALEVAGVSEIDLFAVDNMFLSELVQKKLIRSLDSLKTVIPEAISSSFIRLGEFDDRLWFLPFRPNVQVTYYNETAFKKYGINPPKTWDALLETAKRFYTEEKIGRVVLKGFGSNATATQVYEFILQAGGDPYSFTDGGCKKAFHFLQELAPYLSLSSKRAKWDTVNEILARREAYLAQNWPYGILILSKKYRIDTIKTYSGWRGPAGEVHVIGGDVFGIPKNSRNLSKALLFIRFMLSKEIQQILLKQLGWPSVRDDVYQNASPELGPYFESVRQALAHGVFRKNTLFWPLYSKYINRAFNDIVWKKEPVEKTLEKYKIEFEKRK